MAGTEYTRLHITPLNPTLLNTIVPASALSSARNISYHTIQTFPDRAYGYVDLPVMEAEKLKKKLNGSILKGTKVRIEKARLEKALSQEEDVPERPPKETKSSKRKRETLPGVDIGERSVKRGWTEPKTKLDKRKEKGKSNSVKSKYTSGKECLFKTVLPPNVASNVPAAATREVKLKKRKSKKGKDAVVHEFAKTTKYATFLRNPAGGQTKGVAEFIEGKGWVDTDGNVVEEHVKERRASSRTSKMEVEDAVSHSRKEESDSEESEDAASHSQEKNNPFEESASEEENCMSAESDKVVSPPAKEALETLSSGSDEDSNSSPPSGDHSGQDASSSEEEASTSNNNPRFPSAALKIKIPDPAISISPAKSVHPLEALYKRPRPAANKTDMEPNPPSFTFFGTGDDDGDDDLKAEAVDQVQIPMTPFTQRDFEYRGIRSAAPTPDTSYANKRFIWPTDKDDADENEAGNGASSPIRKGESSQTPDVAKGAKPETDFQKWFWENRGETNRAWKKRRKVVAKEKRQRENRKRNDQTV